VLKQRPGYGVLGDVYGLYKQATVGDVNIGESPSAVGSTWTGIRSPRAAGLLQAGCAGMRPNMFLCLPVITIPQLIRGQRTGHLRGRKTTICIEMVNNFYIFDINFKDEGF